MVLNIFGIDIHKDEGLWFCNVDFCLENNIPVRKFIQKPGDIVFINAGTLHWVRSKGIAVNSAWNIALKNFEVFQEIFKKTDINREIHFPSLVPVRLMTLELMKREFTTLPKDLLSLCLEKLKNFVAEEDEKRRKKHNFIKEPQNSSVFFCDMCEQELFLYWVHCENPECLTKYNCFFCAKCSRAHEKICKSPQLQNYQKFEDDEIQDFILEIEEYRKTGKMPFKIKENKVSDKKEEEKYKIKKKSTDKEELVVSTNSKKTNGNDIMEHRLVMNKILKENKMSMDVGINSSSNLTQKSILSALISGMNK